MHNLCIRIFLEKLDRPPGICYGKGMKESKCRSECGFAEKGTYGHECGKPAVIVAVKKSELTVDGLFYTGRCANHSQRKDGEGEGIIRLEPFNGQTNKWM